MIKENISDRLYSIQLRLKKNNVNTRRKREEIIQLRESFENQVQKYISAIHDSAIDIWDIIKVNRNEITKSMLSIPSTPKKDSSAKDITQVMIQQRKKMNRYFSLDDSVDSLESFLFMLSVFGFCWCEEECMSFTELLINSDEDIAKNMCLCLITNPMTQLFFVSALKPLFNSFESETIEKLELVLLSSIREFGPIMPLYLRKLFLKYPKLFWDQFLLLFFDNYSLFGLYHPEFSLYFSEKLLDFKSRIISLFCSCDYVNSLNQALHMPSVCILPKESLLLTVSPSYQPLTLISPYFSQKFNGESESKFVFLHYFEESNHIDIEQNRSPISTLSRSFLLEAELMHIDSNFSSILDYFSSVATLSSFYGNANLERDLDNIETLLLQQTLSIEDFVQMMEKELDIDESFFSSGLLKEISEYSIQNSQINKLTEISKLIKKNSENLCDFIEIERNSQSFFESQFNPSKNPEDFVSVYNTLCNSLFVNPKKTSSFRNTFSILLSHYDIQAFEKLNRHDDDEKLHQFILTNRQEIMDINTHSFLTPFKQDPNRLSMFNESIRKAFNSKLPFTKIQYLHSAYTILNGLLKSQNIGEIGADQVVPFSVLSTAIFNPYGLYSSFALFSELIIPLLTTNNPVECAEEYSLVQFLSTFRFLFKVFEDKISPK